MHNTIDTLKRKAFKDNKTPIQTTFDQKGDSAKLEMVTERRVKTLEDLIKVAEIDTEIWEIERFTCNKWEVASSSKTKEGQVTGFTVQDLWQVKATMKKRVDAIALREIRDEILKQIEKKSPRVQKIPFVKSDSHLIELDLFDPHIGKLAWGKESGENYDLKIGIKRYEDSITDLIEKIEPYPVEKFLLPVTGDFFNINSSDMQTFAGTPQSEDVRWKKTFVEGWKLLTSSIERLGEIAPVDVIIIPGNHDFDSLFYAGEVLSAYFRNNKNVNVDNTPKTRKYYRYGLNLLGFAHGNEEKIVELPMLMANETGTDFGETKFRECHVGHFHSKREYNFMSTKENKGVTVRVLRALTSVDEWHYKKGYIGAVKSAEAFIYSKKTGMVCNIMVNI